MAPLALAGTLAGATASNAIYLVPPPPAAAPTAPRRCSLWPWERGGRGQSGKGTRAGAAGVGCGGWRIAGVARGGPARGDTAARWRHGHAKAALGPVRSEAWQRRSRSGFSCLCPLIVLRGPRGNRRAAPAGPRRLQHAVLLRVPCRPPVGRVRARRGIRR